MNSEIARIVLRMIVIPTEENNMRTYHYRLNGETP